MNREANTIIDGIDDWQEKNLVPGLDKSLTSQSCCQLFESLNYQKTQSFFKDWIKKTLKDEAVGYEVTSVSSYCKSIPEVEYGYNRVKQALPQINIGMFCCETKKLPLYYNRYSGSLSDKTNLSPVLAKAREVGLDDVKVVLNGGLISQESFSSLSKLSKAFTIGLSTNLDISKEMISSHLHDINMYPNKLPGLEIFCLQQQTSIYGISGKLMLYFDPQNQSQLCSELSERIEQLSAELSKLKRCPVNKLSRFSKYFEIVRHDKGNGFDFKVDNDAVNKMMETKGFFLIFTTDMLAKPEDSLYYYRAKDADEKFFEQLKLNMRGSRVRTYNQHTTDGKIFVAFIALVIRAYILGKLNKYITEDSSSLKKAMNKLENIIIVHSHGNCRFSKALTKQQKDILTPFNAAVDIFTSLNSYQKALLNPSV
ncbi:MAG: hypothetical protein LBV23_07470 [Deltaproteobacteria bacterium]|jgi:transposase|nr:hypothetical protein [Deltaproteobacteria bacterium]